MILQSLHLVNVYSKSGFCRLFNIIPFPRTLGRLSVSVTIHFWCMEEAMKVNGDWSCRSLTVSDTGLKQHNAEEMRGFHFSSSLCWETLSNANACFKCQEIRSYGPMPESQNAWGKLPGSISRETLPRIRLQLFNHKYISIKQQNLLWQLIRASYKPRYVTEHVLQTVKSTSLCLSRKRTRKRCNYFPY